MRKLCSGFLNLGFSVGVSRVSAPPRAAGERDILSLMSTVPYVLYASVLRMSDAVIPLRKYYVVVVPVVRNRLEAHNTPQSNSMYSKYCFLFHRCEDRWATEYVRRLFSDRLEYLRRSNR